MSTCTKWVSPWVKINTKQISCTQSFTSVMFSTSPPTWEIPVSFTLWLRKQRHRKTDFFFFFTRIGVDCWLWTSWTLESIYSEGRHGLAQILKTLKTSLLLFFLIQSSWHSPNCEYIWRQSEHGDDLHTEFIYDEEKENRLEWKEGQIPSNMMTHNTSATIQKEDCPSNLAT